MTVRATMPNVRIERCRLLRRLSPVVLDLTQGGGRYILGQSPAACGGVVYFRGWQRCALGIVNRRNEHGDADGYSITGSKGGFQNL